MRIPLLVFQIYVLALESQFSEGQHNRKDAIICSDSENSQTLRCGDDEVLRIHGATYAYMSRSYACSTSIIPDIEARTMECKVGDLLPRCNGERVCTIEPREAAQSLQSLQKCCDTTEECYSTTDVLHVRYSCVTVVTLPLPHGDVTGKALRVLSSSYPSNIPSQLKTVSCSVAAASAITSAQSVILELGLFVTFNPLEEECEEKFTFAFPSRSDPHIFCIQNGEKQRNVSEKHPVSPVAENLFEFTYSKNFFAEGGVFVLDIEAFQSEKSVDLKISCTNQEHFFTVLTSLPPPRVTPSVSSPSLSSSPPDDSPTAPRPLDGTQTDVSLSANAPITHGVTSTPDGSQRDHDVKDPSMELEKESTKESKDYMWIGIVVGVIVVVITAVIIVVCVVYRVRKRRQEKKNGRRMELVATSPTTTPFPSPESVAIYSVARDVDEDVQNGNLTQQEIGDVSQMYAVVDKSRKTKAKSNNESNVVNDVMSADNGDVIMCENDELYDAMSPGEDKQNIKKDVNLTRDSDSVIMFENTELYSQ